MAVKPSAISNATLTSGQVTYTVNVFNSSAINLFDVRLTYNYRVLHAASIDSAANVLGKDAQVLYNCLDGVQPPGACDTLDTAGVAHFSLYLLGNVSVTPPATGVLFKITFNIVSTGHNYTQLHLIPGGDFGTKLLCSLACGAQSAVPIKTQDSYYNSKTCGGQLCKPPITDFTISPPIALQGRVVTFNATTSKPTNPNAVIRFYNWTWGDNQNPSSGRESVTTHIYKSTGNFSVTLTVMDNFTISWAETLTVQIVKPYVQLLVGQITILPRDKVIPGSIVKITADIINNSTLPESSNMTIAIEGQILGGGASKQFSLGAFRQITSVTVSWNTTGYSPRVYRVDAIVIEPKGANSTRGDRASGYVQLVEPPSSAASLTLLESTGLGIIVLAGIVFAVTRLRRRPSYADEPL